jgi:hypothetical protein
MFRFVGSIGYRRVLAGQRQGLLARQPEHAERLRRRARAAALDGHLLADGTKGRRAAFCEGRERT